MGNALRIGTPDILEGPNRPDAPPRTTDNGPMKIQRVVQPPKEVKSDWLILGHFEDEFKPPVGLEGSAVAATVERLRTAKEVAGTAGELTVLPEPSGLAAGGLLLVGLGPRARFDAGAAFSAAVAASKRLAAKARESVALVLPDVQDLPAVASAMVEGAVVGTRGPGLRLSEPNRHPFGSLSIVEPGGTEPSATEALDAARRGEIVGQAVNFARDLANTPPVEKCRPGSPTASGSWPSTPGSRSRSGTRSGSSRSGSVG